MPVYSSLTKTRILPMETLYMSIDGTEHRFWNLESGSTFAVEPIYQTSRSGIRDERVVGYRLRGTAKIIQSNIGDMAATLTAIDNGLVQSVNIGLIGKEDQPGAAVMAIGFFAGITPGVRRIAASWRAADAVWRPALEINFGMLATLELELDDAFLQVSGF